MQDTDIPLCAPNPPSAQEDRGAAIRIHKPLAFSHAAGGYAPGQKSLLRRFMMALRALFSPAPSPSLKPLAVKMPASAEAVAERALQPVAFKGGTAITLASPMGAYAGKPGQQRMRKLAEQQFYQMDVTQTTMN